MDDKWICARDFPSIDDLPFTDEQKRLAMVWMAGVLWDRLGVGKLGLDGHSKSYDPLSFTADGRVHTYVFNLQDGGRHHEFTSFADLESRIIDETAEAIGDQHDFLVAPPLAPLSPT
jgi:hypothetical protein